MYAEYLARTCAQRVQTIYELAQAHAVTYMPIATVKPIAGMSPVLVATAAGSDRAPPPTMLFTKLHVAQPIDVPAGADTCANALAGATRGRRIRAMSLSLFLKDPTQPNPNTQFGNSASGHCLPARSAHVDRQRDPALNQQSQRIPACSSFPAS